MITRDLYRYWAKTGRDGAGDIACHVLVYHCLDVAAVVWVLLGRERLWLERLAQVLGLEPEVCRGVLVRLAMVHDIGKYMPSFQGLRLDVVTKLGGVCPTPPPKYATRHDTMGKWAWDRVIWPWLWARRTEPFMSGLWLPLWEKPKRVEKHVRRAWEPLVAATMGHHGTPPKTNKMGNLNEGFLAAGPVRDAIEAHVEGCWGLLGVPQTAASATPSKVGSWAVAGVMVVCDWLGSDRRFFPFEETPMPLESYWRERALPQAKCAVDASGLTGRSAARWRGFGALFPKLRAYGPRPMQRWASEVELGEGPHLVLLEDETGSGKTEAALVLAHRLMARGEGRGVYVALPTMATANAMYGRLGEAYRRLFEDGDDGDTGAPSLVLAHGQARDNALFQESVVRQTASEAEREDARYGDDGEETVTAYCSAWLADRRKAALWADVGVGTIDQALTGVLPVKHQSMRLGGLMRSVLIVDEVHGYDPYMTALLENLLRVQAALGGSAVLLSATLPESVRSTLIAAYTRGLDDAGLDAPAKDSSAGDAYPRAEVMWPGGGVQQEVPSRSTPRRVEVAWVTTAGEAVKVLAQAADDGRCACWIRNTVGDALEGAQAVRQHVHSDHVTLFHARFTGADRARIEADVVERFGPDSTAAKRAGRVVVATQVVEQSLDLDFDVMVIDLAPIDLIVQRAGRLRRHRRDALGEPLEGEGVDARGAVRLHVLAPSWDETPGGSWYRALLPRAAFVYPHVGQLWLTMRALRDGGGWETPNGVRACVEAVYGASAQAQIPETLERASVRAKNKAKQQHGAGDQVALSVALGYGASDDDKGWSSDDRAMTRLGEPTVTVRLTERCGGKWVPLGSAQKWSQAEVRVALRHIARRPNGKAGAPWLRAMSDRARWAVVVPMVRGLEPDVWEGDAHNARGEEVRVRYTCALGLSVEKVV